MTKLSLGIELTSLLKSLLELTSNDAILAQNKLLPKKIEAFTDQFNKILQQLHSLQLTQPSNMQVKGCTLCGSAHKDGLCIGQEEANRELNYMASQNCQSYKQGGNQGYNQKGNQGYYRRSIFSQNQG